MSGPKPTDPNIRFDRLYIPEPMSGCWIWLGGTKGIGYGIFGIPRKKYVSAHRFSYERYKGTIPDGLQIDHLCRNPSCVNPDHLEAVTALENMKRTPSYKGRLTHCKRGHEFTEENTFYYTSRRGTARMCRACNREKQKEMRNARKNH